MEIDALKNRKYDYVVGNPPWLGILRVEKAALEQYKKYDSARGKFDIYVLFIELGIRLLAENGKLGYITQNRFIKVDYATALRKYIVSNAYLLHLSNFGDLKVFADATNYPAILILQKKLTNGHFSYVEFKKKAEEISSKELLDQLQHDLDNEEPESDILHVLEVDQQSLKESGWTFGTEDSSILLNKLNGLPRLKDFTEEIMQGVTAGGEGSDKIFYVAKDKVRDFEGEEEILKPVLRGKDIRRYYFKEPSQLLIFPYDSEGKPVDLRLYPRIRSYLENYKAKLSSRKLDGKTLAGWNKQWFELWRKREPKYFEKKKIVCPRISESNRFVIDDDKHYLTDSSVAIVPKDINIDLLLGLLNSKLLQWYMPSVSTFVQGRYYNYSKTYIERIPIKRPQKRNEERICENIIANVREIRKAIRKSGSTEEISRLIDDTDKLVFDLYSLTEEERQIVGKELETKFNASISPEQAQGNDGL